MKIVFRVDASSAMGGGHVVRCHTLAKALRRRGAKVTFVCRDHSGNLIENLIRDSFQVMVLPPPKVEAVTTDDYADWLGVHQLVDARETKLALENEKPHWLIVDHYALDEKWECKMRPFVKKIMVIDDLANRPHDCELLLDQNFSANSKERYRNLVKEGCINLLGPRYALLHKDYNVYRKTQQKHKGEVNNILIYLGGVDPDNLTCKVLQSFTSPSLSHLHVSVVVGNNNTSNWDEIKQLVSHRPLTQLHKPSQSLVDLIAQSDFALGAGGATTWERLCLGLPALLVSVAENQNQACVSLANAGFINYAGDSSSLTIGKLQEYFENLIKQPAKLIKQANLGKLLVDGLGVLRVAEIMYSSNSDKLILLRPAEQSDFYNCHSWEINDDEFLQQSASLALKWNQRHTDYLEILANPAFRIYVAEIGALIVGRLIFDKRKRIILVNSSVDPLFLSDKAEANTICDGLNLVYSGRIRKILPDKGLLDSSAEYLAMRDAVDEVEVDADKNKLSISILSDKSSWINQYIPELKYNWLNNGHNIIWVHEPEQLGSGDFCFYLSCSKIISKHSLSNFKNNLVVHEIDLPKGR